jgi:RNA polymerase sigma-70 factor (ECF subfamily)
VLNARTLGGVQRTVRGMAVQQSTRTPIDEAALVARARAGDREAQDALVRRYLADVYRIAYRLLGEEDLAQDAAQDAMVNAIRGLDRFRGESSFRTWVLRIAANSAKSHARRRWRKREVDWTVVEDVASDGADPEESVAVRDEAERANRMLAGLPRKQRLAVELRVNQGLDYPDVARILNCSTGAARVNYHLGIKRLRELMR